MRFICILNFNFLRSRFFQIAETINKLCVELGDEKRKCKELEAQLAILAKRYEEMKKAAISERVKSRALAKIIDEFDTRKQEGYGK